MDSEKKLFNIEFTDECIEEMIEIYDYISITLKERESAKRLIEEVNKRVLSLAESPELYMKIRKVDRLKREYHRIVIKNYIVLYTVDLKNRKIFISRMFYRKRNYLK